MATICFTPILGKRIRVTALDDCGNVPETAEEGYVATDGFISVNITAEVEDGTEIITKKANGDLCVNEKQANSLKRLNLEVEFCGVNPSLLSFMTNAETYAGYTPTEIIGITVAEGAINKKFAFELWTGISAGACAPGEEASGYLLLPFVNAGLLGDLTVDGENAVTFSMTGAYTKGGNAWGVGPYDVLMDTTPEEPLPPVPGPLPTALDPMDHLLLVSTSVAPPPDSCDPLPLPVV